MEKSLRRTTLITGIALSMLATSLAWGGFEYSFFSPSHSSNLCVKILNSSPPIKISNNDIKDAKYIGCIFRYFIEMSIYYAVVTASLIGFNKKLLTYVDSKKVKYLHLFLFVASLTASQLIFPIFKYTFIKMTI